MKIKKFIVAALIMGSVMLTATSVYASTPAVKLTGCRGTVQNFGSYGRAVSSRTAVANATDSATTTPTATKAPATTPPATTAPPTKSGVTEVQANTDTVFVCPNGNEACIIAGECINNGHCWNQGYYANDNTPRRNGTGRANGGCGGYGGGHHGGGHHGNW